MNIGDRIKSRRKELGLTVDEVALKLKKNRATVYRYESQHIENLPINILEPLAEVLETTPAYLMGWTDNPINYEDGDLIASISPSILEHFNGDVEKSLAFLKKVEDDALSDAYPSNTVPYTPGVPVRVIGSAVITASHMRTLTDTN